MKVFWSWQSDTPGMIGRHFVRECLDEAVKLLKEPTPVEEPIEREIKASIHVDQDRQGVPGSPNLAATIFSRIATSSVFVADVTAVANVFGLGNQIAKHNMNPNVAIELGYALGVLSDQKLLMVMNTHFGGFDTLPFDLRHKAGPLSYHLGPDCSKDELARAKKGLVSELKKALAPFVREMAVTSETGAKPRKEAAIGITRACPFGRSDEIGRVGAGYDDVVFATASGNGAYLRVIPIEGPDKPIPIARLRNLVLNVIPMWHQHTSALFSSNKLGAAAIEPDSMMGGDPKSITQIFPWGEVWGFDPWIVRERNGATFLPGIGFEKTYEFTIQRYAKFIHEHLSLSGPFAIEAGVVGISGYALIADQNGDEEYGPIVENEIFLRRHIKDLGREAREAFLLEFFELVFDHTGFPRPKNWRNFPPKGPGDR